MYMSANAMSAAVVVVDKTLTPSPWNTLKWTMPLKFSDLGFRKLKQSESRLRSVLPV